ncbi:stalk domain-containing protein [Paenibacillus filicis]|uniref:Stalk domain-containing protein n=1 Tax=Paenibacillus gyeongsangnamensis TaxID=3388067 RepID=A0ABT4QDX4_9BACL|nr:stalk domain-containing protein [Paenibacillus filicis]MCZ8514971.1 stalk domain-containing protein [Paenibacillus filicis]
MRTCYFLMITVLLCALITIPSRTFAGSDLRLPDDQGLELNWTFTETPPKRPQPKILNPENYEVKWKIDNSTMTSLVQDPKGVLYTSSKGMVYAIYPNGKEKWKIPLDMGFNHSSVINIVLGQDGTVYAYSSDLLSKAGQITTIYALSPEGTIQWKLQTQENVYSELRDQFAGDAQGNLVYFTREGLTSRNAKGEVNWVNTSITSSAPRDYSKNSHKVSVYMDTKGNVYVDSAQGEVISVDSSGAQRWRTTPLAFVNKFDGFKPYISNQEILYFLNKEGVHALQERDGSVVDPHHLDLTDLQSSGLPTDGKDGYYIINKGRLQKITREGTLIWQYEPRDTEKKEIVFAEEPLADQDGNVYFTTGVGNIIALNPEGQEIFVFLRNAFWSKLVDLTLGKNGDIYSTNNDIGLVSFGKKQIEVYMNNLSVPLSAAPMNLEGTVVVPFRSLFENMGLKVEWDPALKTISGSKEGLTLKLTIGDPIAYVNGVEQPLSVSPIIDGGTTYIPLRFVGEALGRNVSWDETSSSINID